MSSGKDSYQRGIIKRYYEHRDDLMAQKLSEIVSDLYVCTDPLKAARLWKSAGTALKNSPVPPSKAERCVEERDLEMLAKILEDIF